jgi:hypothetical protein
VAVQVAWLGEGLYSVDSVAEASMAPGKVALEFKVRAGVEVGGPETLLCFLK